MSVYAWNPFPKKVPANFQSALNGCTCLENFSTLPKKENKIQFKPHITLEEYTAKTSESQIDATIAMGIKANQLIANSDIFLEKMKKGVPPF